MKKVSYIALNTFKEAVRDKVLYTILAFAMLMIASSSILATLSVGGEVKLIEDLGLASISLFGTIMAIFIGIGLVSKEIEKRTVYTIISKPIHRYQFILGKFLGLVITLAVNVGVMALGLLVLSAIGRQLWDPSVLVPGRFKPWNPALLLAVAMIFLELAVITAVAILFSSFSTPTLSAIFTLAIFVIGRLSTDLKLFAAQFGGRNLRAIVNAIYYLLPNLSSFNIKGQVVHGTPLSPSYIIYTIIYGLFYLSVVLILSMFVFQRRDFK